MAIATVNPATGQLIKSFEALSDAQLEVKLQKAADAFSSYRNVRCRDFGRRKRNLCAHDDDGDGQDLPVRRR